MSVLLALCNRGEVAEICAIKLLAMQDFIISFGEILTSTTRARAAALCGMLMRELYIIRRMINYQWNVMMFRVVSRPYEVILSETL